MGGLRKARKDEDCIRKDKGIFSGSDPAKGGWADAGGKGPLTGKKAKEMDAGGGDADGAYLHGVGYIWGIAASLAQNNERRGGGREGRGPKVQKG